MKKLCFPILLLVLIGTRAFAGQGTAVPAGYATFDSGNCTAKFVRSASGIINESQRKCTGRQNPWADSDVYIQFRPLTGPANPNCDPVGLVTAQGTWTNFEYTLEKYFIPGAVYNQCIYLVNPVVAAGSLNSADEDGITTTPLPVVEFGRYRVCVSGTYANGTSNLADAKYTSIDAWATHQDALAGSEWLGEGFGEVQVDNQFVPWGNYDKTHRYCYAVFRAYHEQINLAVFDGYGLDNSPTKVPAWYLDNSGNLPFTVTFIGK
jgi:hypothetical protein